MEITQVILKEHFIYKDGFLYWQKSHVNNVKDGQIAGYINPQLKGGSRRIIGINKRQYFASRLIFLFHNGWLPKVVDHKDRNPLNDKIDNLRASSQSENCKNATHQKGKSSKYKGVCYSKLLKKWRCTIGINGTQLALGCFKEEMAAAKAYNEAAIIYFGEFANLNIIENNTLEPVLK